MLAILALLSALSGLGETHGIPEPLIQSIAWHESRGSDLAVSPCLARGRLQVRHSSVCRGCSNSGPFAKTLHVYQINRYQATRILSRWLRRANRAEGCRGCRAAWVRALRGYNGGNRAFRHEGEVGRRSQGYALRVLRRSAR
jgi:soluble lytic murein transglycosylase-like protein